MSKRLHKELTGNVFSSTFAFIMFFMQGGSIFQRRHVHSYTPSLKQGGGGGEEVIREAATEPLPPRFKAATLWMRTSDSTVVQRPLSALDLLHMSCFYFINS